MRAVQHGYFIAVSCPVTVTLSHVAVCNSLSPPDTRIHMGTYMRPAWRDYLQGWQWGRQAFIPARRHHVGLVPQGIRRSVPLHQDVSFSRRCFPHYHVVHARLRIPDPSQGSTRSSASRGVYGRRTDDDGAPGPAVPPPFPARHNTITIPERSSSGP